MTGYLIGLIHLGILGVILANLRYLKRTSGAPRLAEYPRLSVIIPARNEEADLPHLLDTLFEQDYPDYEVIVYDDGSEDGTAGILAACTDPRLRVLRGEGPPQGWVGKPHALYQATREATGAHYLFLDADVALLSTHALRRLVDIDASQHEDAVTTGFVRLGGGGKLLVSLVPNTILGGLPWPLVRRLRLRSLGALNGQCWLIDSSRYHRLEPHKKVRDQILEDVEIGRYLLEEGFVPTMFDARQEVVVRMYRSHLEAWQGFRKNAYLLVGGNALSFLFLYLFYLFTFTLCFLFSPWLLLSLYLLKTVTDRFGKFPLWVSLLAPLSYALGSLLQLHSAFSHWSGRVAWKGRNVRMQEPQNRVR